MRSWSLFLALALVASGASSAGSSEGRLPGAGTFAYLGTPAAEAAAVRDGAVWRGGDLAEWSRNW